MKILFPALLLIACAKTVTTDKMQKSVSDYVAAKINAVNEPGLKIDSIVIVQVDTMSTRDTLFSNYLDSIGGEITSIESIPERILLADSTDVARYRPVYKLCYSLKQYPQRCIGGTLGVDLNYNVVSDIESK